MNKNIQNFVWFPKQYILGFFILESQLADILDRSFLFLCNTLLLYSFLSFFFSINQHRYRHNSFSKISRSFCGGRINLYVKQFQYSICIRSIWTKTNTEISFSFWLTLFYSISLSQPLQTDGRTEEQIHSLRVGWRNYFYSCAVVSVFF